jgi:RNA polymerase sigma-70 factor (ECF subfamily)
MPIDPPGSGVGRAIEHLVLGLPPKERACVLLKDVFDYSLDEIAELVGSTVGGVKAALSRGRSKLAELPRRSTSRHKAKSAHAVRLLDLYVERFNRRDWDGVRELIRSDASVSVADRFSGRLIDSPYFGRYDRVTSPWRMAVGEVDGESVIITLQRGPDAWTPQAIVRLDFSDQQIIRIADYTHCPWVLSAASSVVVANPVSGTSRISR